MVFKAIVFVSILTLSYTVSNPTEDLNGGKLWALLVAGSNTYDNYRHQADICHAYQLLHKNGIPDENIVVMMYDDIAYNQENPTPGVIVNYPNGTDVYKGVVKDYTGEDVNPKNFLKVLMGDEEGMQGIGSGKVIKSGPKDHVFVNFADHGAPGLLAFPDGELQARELMGVLQQMYMDHKFSRLVLYVEACESGSMFENLLPNNINIFATTAANAEESSYACYFDDQRMTYLGDVYSVMWMQDSDMENPAKETLKHQYNIVREETNTSHVEEYGNLMISQMHVSSFQGHRDTPSCNCLLRAPQPEDTVVSHDVPVAILQKRLEKETSVKGRKKIEKKIRHMKKLRQYLADTVFSIVQEATGSHSEAKKIVSEKLKLADFSCYEKLTARFSQRCFQLSKNPYALRHLYVLVNMCEKEIPPSAVFEALDKVCQGKLLKGIL